MNIDLPDALLVGGLSIFLFLALLATLVLVVVSLRRPTPPLLSVAAGILILCALLVAISPVTVPALVGLGLAAIGVTIAVVGGNPVTRRVLEIATGGRVHETADGGILLPVAPSAGESGEMEPLLRGGTTIGYLERLGVVMSIIAGFPEAIAVIVAIKGIGRFSELAAADARERFIVGTFASLLWACLAGAIVRLAIW